METNVRSADVSRESVRMVCMIVALVIRILLGINGDGSCACNEGWAGKYCDVCDANRWGPNCTLCSCVYGVCNTTNGDCRCNLNYIGKNCSDCKPNHWGIYCMPCLCGPNGRIHCCH